MKSRGTINISSPWLLRWWKHFSMKYKYKFACTLISDLWWISIRELSTYGGLPIIVSNFSYEGYSKKSIIKTSGSFTTPSSISIKTEFFDLTLLKAPSPQDGSSNLPSFSINEIHLSTSFSGEKNWPNFCLWLAYANFSRAMAPPDS